MTGVELLVGFASSLIKTVHDRVEKFLYANYELQKDTKMMVRELKIALLSCEGFVIEVQKKPILNNRALADWLRILKETVYDAEDVLDNIEAKSIKEKVQRKNQVLRFASSSLSTVRNMFVPDDDLKSLNMVLVHLNKLSTDIPNILTLINMNENNESHTRKVNISRETISQPFGNVALYGRQVELNKILEIIFVSESESSKKGGHIIPIVGMGGVGKTALAQAVYNKTEVKETFKKRAWISVSNKPDVDVKWVMHKICQSLGFSSRSDLNTLDYMSKKITSYTAKVGKFLIVLDDIYEIIRSESECLKLTLSRCSPDSVILITTQNQVLANRVATSGPIELSTLSSDKYWELFECFAFGNQMPPNREALTQIGKEIAAKLLGLPLAAKIIGNQLRSKVDEVEWRKILDNEWWNIREVKSQILPSIGLGYEQLDPSLQQCFAYCSVFPRKSLIEKDRLVHIWIAQNFIQSDDNGGFRNLEKIGRQWFDMLVEQSFFQRVGDDNSYVMHDLMHDLAVIVTSRECFYLGEGLDKIPLGVLHLAVDTHNLDVIKGIRAHKNLRSILYLKRGQVEGMYSAINKMLSNLDSIRVLDLSHMCMRNEKKPPTSIWKLKHLRFLDLSSTGIKHLTRSSIGLYHLQVLYIRKSEFVELPSDIFLGRQIYVSA